MAAACLPFGHAITTSYCRNSCSPAPRRRARNQRPHSIHLKYPLLAPQSLRTRQGKLEKSFLSFVATYPTWQPTGAGQALLRSVEAAPLRDSWAAASGGALDASASQMGPGLSLSLGAASAPDDAGWGAEQRVLRSQVLLQSLYDAQAPFCPPQEAWDGSPNGHALVAPPRHEAQEGGGPSGQPITILRDEHMRRELSAELLPMHKYGFSL